ncbi:MAG: DUF4391 domain-containing protein [Proteobacteria bacterium]|nr:DUF4391 domain-containing protein [Pseudomonadota bacterium]
MSALIQYPPQAAYGRALPKNKLYEHSGAGSRLRALFVAQVEQIVWQYKLAPETINLPASTDVPEIQIFTLHLKTPELDAQVLRCIDGAVPFPIVFELVWGDRRRVSAAWKRPATADATRWQASDHFTSPWLPADATREPLPVAVSLAGLYEALLRRLVPLQGREGEPLAALIDRAAQVRAKEREVAHAARKLERERQFNRRVEANAVLRQLRAELAQLTS